MKVFAEDLQESDQRRVRAVFEEHRPRVLPADWRLMTDHWNAAWYRSRDGLTVCIEAEIHDLENWLHLSVSRRDKDPSYFDLQRVKALFIGRERKAIQVIPPESEYYNFHPHCLHLWSPLDRDPLPDFRHSSGAL